jgi:hypothetical protein
MRSRSNSASPPNTVKIKRPCDVVSAQASPSASGSARLVGDRRYDVEKVARRSRQAIEPRNQKHVAGVDLVKRAAKLGAVGLRAARGLAPK